MLRCGACLAALALAAVVASPAFADEVDDFIKKVDALRYSPAEHGLKDMKVQFKSSMFAMNPAMASLQVFIYWKAPDKAACKFEGVDDAMAGMMGPMTESFKGFAKLIVPESMGMTRDKYDYTMSKEDGMVVLTAVPKPGTDEAATVTQRKTWFDDRCLPVRMVSEGQSPSSNEMTFLEKDGRFLVESNKGEAVVPNVGKQSMTMSFTYAQVDWMWFPDVITQQVMGQSFEMSFTGYEVNKGLDDAIFDSSAKNEDK